MDHSSERSQFSEGIMVVTYSSLVVVRSLAQEMALSSRSSDMEGSGISTIREAIRGHAPPEIFEI